MITCTLCKGCTFYKIFVSELRSVEQQIFQRGLSDISLLSIRGQSNLTPAACAGLHVKSTFFPMELGYS